MSWQGASLTTRGATGCAEHLGLLRAAFEIARDLVGRLARQFVRIGVGRRVDLGGGTDRARKSFHATERFQNRDGRFKGDEY